MKGRDEVSADPEKCRRPRSRIEAVVGTWEREWQDEFLERSGILMDGGASQEKADAQAYAWVSKRRAASLRRAA